MKFTFYGTISELHIPIVHFCKMDFFILKCHICRNPTTSKFISTDTLQGTDTMHNWDVYLFFVRRLVTGLTESCDLNEENFSLKRCVFMWPVVANTVVFLWVTVYMKSIKLCMMITSVELFTFIPVVATLT